jgi:FecR-like protein
MPRNALSLSLFIAISCAFFIQPSFAGPLTSAEVTKIINRVSVIEPAKGGHPAAIREVIKDDLALRTGEKSRSELLFQDNTLTRIGAETFFSFKTGTRDMSLEKGSMLLQVPKGLGGATIHTAAVTAAITGTTIMMEYVPNRYIKVLVLEGSLRLSRNGTFGDSLVLHPGKMVIMRPDAKKIPDPIDVDLEHIVKTSTLVNFSDAAPLPSMSLIQAAIAEQAKQLAENKLAPTNLVMGSGTKVTLIPSNPLSPTSGVLGGTLSGPNASLKNGTASLPLVGNVISTLGTTTGSTTTTVNNLLGSATGTVGALTNNLLGAPSATTSMAVSSSTQLLSLLDNAVQNTAGVVTVVPTTVTNVVTSVLAAAPTGGVTSNPTVSSATATSTTPTGVLATVTSVPTTLLTGTVPTQNSPTASLPLGLGH